VQLGGARNGKPAAEYIKNRSFATSRVLADVAGVGTPRSVRDNAWRSGYCLFGTANFWRGFRCAALQRRAKWFSRLPVRHCWVYGLASRRCHWRQSNLRNRGLRKRRPGEGTTRPHRREAGVGEHGVADSPWGRDYVQPRGRWCSTSGARRSQSRSDWCDGSDRQGAEEGEANGCAEQVR
jgi:hypothetical protein